ncbi:MAG TPA: protein phosphatase 2C domain-containing protein [Pseudolysinimonas sp.]|nr:protein phosphatase 2C domain-containing protein [Pseudolysinimonas sp.]
MSQLGADSSGHVIVVAPDREITLAWAARSDVGKRRTTNEDSVVTVSPVFAVADGMGGHSAGDRASAAAVEHLSPRRGVVFLDLDTLEASLAAAAADIDTLAIGVPLGVGTTVTGAVLVMDEGEPTFAVFNIGDSRVYRFENNELRRVTVDHSVVQELVDAGVISADDAESHPDSNIITRALGFRDDPRPDIWMLPVQVGMRLLICSDGLTKELGDERIRMHLAAGMPADETASALVDGALASGGRDNVTVVVVDVLKVSDDG